MDMQLKKEILIRKEFYNQLQDLKGNIRVFCRIRPINSSEFENCYKNIINQVDEQTIVVQTKNGNKQFQYDKCYGPNSTQDEIFEETKKLVQSAVDGYNVCIFAYGQTGSGKTYTIQGNKANKGITPRAVDELFRITEQMDQNYTVEISIYIVEIYKDNIHDLLLSKNAKNNTNLEIKEDLNGLTYISNVQKIYVNSKDQLHQIIKQGIIARKTDKTNMNDESSRSHLIITIQIEVQSKFEEIKTIGKLSLIDLAGSERQAKANTSMSQLNEAKSINKSLAALGDVVHALTTKPSQNKDKFVPYRNNKLTQLMKDSIGGKAKALMFINISPSESNTEETINSLQYASRVKLVENSTSKNIEQKQVTELKQKLQSVVDENDNLRQLLKLRVSPYKQKQQYQPLTSHSFSQPKTNVQQNILNASKN